MLSLNCWPREWCFQHPPLPKTNPINDLERWPRRAGKLNQTLSLHFFFTHVLYSLCGKDSLVVLQSTCAQYGHSYLTWTSGCALFFLVQASKLAKLGTAGSGMAHLLVRPSSRFFPTGRANTMFSLKSKKFNCWDRIHITQAGCRLTV